MNLGKKMIHKLIKVIKMLIDAFTGLLIAAFAAAGGYFLYYYWGNGIFEISLFASWILASAASFLLNSWLAYKYSDDNGE